MMNKVRIIHAFFDFPKYGFFVTEDTQDDA